MPNRNQLALDGNTSVSEIVEDVSHTLAEVEAGSKALEDCFQGGSWRLDQAREWVAAADACRLIERTFSVCLRSK